MPKLDPDEVEVWCRDCHAKLHNDFAGNFPPLKVQHGIVAVSCPHPKQCQDERDIERYNRAVRHPFKIC